MLIARRRRYKYIQAADRRVASPHKTGSEKTSSKSRGRSLFQGGGSQLGRGLQHIARACGREGQILFQEAASSPLFLVYSTSGFLSEVALENEVTDLKNKIPQIFRRTYIPPMCRNL